MKSESKRLLSITTAFPLMAMSMMLAHNPPRMNAQSSAARPQLEVASVKPCKLGPSTAKGEASGRSRVGGPSASIGRLATGCQTVADLIYAAYVEYANGQQHPPQHYPIEGGPAWIRSERYEIVAKVEGNPPVATMMGPLLQSLLEDRFRLKIVLETKEVPVYAMTTVKGGSKLQPLREGGCIAVDFTSPALDPGQKPCGLPLTS